MYDAVDVVVVREKTEGMYTGAELEQGEPETKELIAFVEQTTGRRVRDDAGISVKAISVSGTERIVRFAFEWAAPNRANPAAMILSGAMLLRHLGEAAPAERVERAVADVIAEGRVVTHDLKPDGRAASTLEMADAVIARL